MSTAVTHKNNSVLDILDSEEDFKLEILCKELHMILNKVPLKVPQECTGFLKCCLRVQCCDINKAAKIVEGVHNAVVAFENIFDMYKPHLSKLIFNQGIYSVLKNKDQFGSRIFLWRVGRWHPSETTCEQMAFTLMLVYFFVLGKFVETQRKGVVAILDFTNFGWEQVRGAKPWLILRVMKLMQHSNPGRMEAIHVIYYPFIFETMAKWIRPVIEEELQERIHFHNQDATSLHKFVAPNVLPVSLGGHLNEEEVHDVDLMRAFLDDDRFLPEMRRLGFPKF